MRDRSLAHDAQRHSFQSDTQCRGPLPINIALLAIGLADLLTTIYWLRTGQATEMNPIMAGALRLSPVLFILVKVATLGAYVAVIEWYRRHRNPLFAKFVSNITVASYIGIYSVSFFAVNGGLLLKF